MHSHRVIHKLHHTHNNVYHMYLYVVMCVVKHYLKGIFFFSQDFVLDFAYKWKKFP